MRGIPGILGRTLGALGRENVNIIAIAQGSSECNISVVVAQKDMRAALVTAHREFQLGTVNCEALPLRSDSRTIAKPEPDAPRVEPTEARFLAGME